MIQQALAKMINDLSITGLTGGVTLGRPPKGVEYPYIVLYKISEITGTECSYAREKMQLSIYASTYIECYNIASRIYELINQNTDYLYNGTYYRFNNIKKENEKMTIESDCYGLIIELSIVTEN